MFAKSFFFPLTIWCCSIFGAYAQLPMQQGAESYQQQHFKEAAAHFEAAIKEAPSTDAYYNLGNVYYRLNNLPQAALAYQRALRLDPSNNDARYNLDFLQRRIASKANAATIVVGASPFDQVLNAGNVQFWTALSLIFLVLSVVLWFLFRVSTRSMVQKTTFGTFSFALLAFLFTTTCAGIQRYRYFHNNFAVVGTENAQSYTSPMLNAKKESQVPVGTTVTIVDESVKGWSRVQLIDGTETWIESFHLLRVTEKE